MRDPISVLTGAMNNLISMAEKYWLFVAGGILILIFVVMFLYVKQAITG